jgi:ABC-type Fe3+ transport system substrate-binding protein
MRTAAIAGGTLPLLHAFGVPLVGRANAAAPDLAALEAAAKQEGTVTFYTFAEAVDVSAKFKADYPWAEVKSFTFATDGQIKSKFLTESRAGANVADVLLAFNTDLPTYLSEGDIAAEELPNDANTIKGLLDPTQHFHPVYQILYIYAYNPNTGVKPPHDPFELADPSWKGKLAFDNPANGSAAAQFLASRRPLWGDEKWRQWLAGLAANDVLETSSAAAAYNAVLQGQRSLAICGYQSVLSQKPGTPMVAGFYDNLLSNPTEAFINAHAPHPNMAKLFLNWLMGPVMQQEYASENRIPAADVDSPISLSKLVPAGETLLPQEKMSDWVNNQNDYLKIYKEYWPT